ncbi:hypothetical protein HYC85_018336 [Camellia sinensis]|uniref:SUF system FeS cluster assembly SufBD core domain-containing protein n=1 Tax=Camellia sinensis TaxID=4442 RepID=A0A7J7GU17_CAMSI|nr:hypothetical protein HYC85_018336 [Camellia sinensis]
MVQDSCAGDDEGKGEVHNFVAKRGVCAGARSKISWIQLETGSAITWKYPSVVLKGDDSVGEFYSVALTKNHQQADMGTNMIHKGKNTRSRIVSKGILAGNSRNCYRGLVQVKNRKANIEHEASISKIGDDQLFYFEQRGIESEKAMAAMISGFGRVVFNELPDEFCTEVKQLMNSKVEGSVG